MPARYSILRSDEDVTAAHLHDDVAQDAKDSLPLWLSISCCFAILSVLASLFAPRTSELQSRAFTLELANKLFQPNVYIGLERLNDAILTSALPERLDIFPHVFAPISNVEPNRVFPNDGNARVTFNGLVSPGEPHIIINKNTSMIAQVRVQDYGFTRCAIASTMPDPTLLVAQNRTLKLSPNTPPIDIWILDSSSGQLDLKTLSWRNRPARVAHLSTLDVRPNEETLSTEFGCGTTGSLRTFEFSCTHDACNIEFWQGQLETTPRMAFTFVQMPLYAGQASRSNIRNEGYSIRES